MNRVKVKTPYSIVGSDYSAQEVRVLASVSEDQNMIKAYAEGKDLYGVIASMCFHNNYEDNLEFHPITKVLQPEGKARRSRAKSLLLGLNYGMSSKSLAERLNSSIKEAESITEEFYSGFTGVDEYTKKSKDMLRKLGYVTDAYGRRRRIPDALLPDFTIKERNSSSKNFNPLLNTKGDYINDSTRDKIRKVELELNKCRSRKDINLVINKASKEGLDIIDNRSRINRTLRQCLNARIQGSSASITKRAMILIDNDELLNNLGFKLLLTVHDEVFGECPKENAEIVGNRLSELMIQAANEKCGKVVWKVDPYYVSRWYEDELSAEVLKDYKKLIKNNKSEEDALSEIEFKYRFLNPTYVEQMCNDTYECNSHEDI